MDTSIVPTMPESSSSPEKLRQGFVLLAESLLKSIAEVFPEVDDCAQALELFQVFVKGNAEREDQFIRKCKELFSNEAESLAAKDPEAIFRVADGLEVLKALDLRAKWADPDFNEESKNHMWQFLQALDTYAGLYCAVPPGILGKIESMATVLGSQMQSGELDLSRLDIGKLGQQLMGSLTKDELHQFEGSTTNIYSSISKVASILQKQTGSNFDVDDLMSRLGELQGTEGGALDRRSVVQQIGSTIAPNLGPELQASVAAMLKTQAGLGGFDISQAQEMLKTLTAPGATSPPGKRRKS